MRIKNVLPVMMIAVSLVMLARPGAAVAAATTPVGARLSLTDVLAMPDRAILARYGVKADLSAQASLIVAVLNATSDVKANCQTPASMRSMMRPVIRAMKRNGRLKGSVWPLAAEAGRYVYFNCDRF